MIPSRMLASQAMGICLASGLLFSACDRAETALPVAPAGQESQVAAAALAGKHTWFQVKMIDFSFPFVLMSTVTVPANATLLATTEHFDRDINSALVAFYKIDAGSTAAFKVKAVGLNDDYTPPQSIYPKTTARIQWTNATGASQSITVVGYASTATQAGLGRLNLQVTTRKTVHHSSHVDGRMSGIAIHNDNPISTGNCNGPSASRIILKNRVGGGFGSSVLAVNATTLNGGYIREEDNVLELKEVLPSGGAHLFLAFMEQQSSSILESTGFRATQENKYFCPAP